MTFCGYVSASFFDRFLDLHFLHLEGQRMQKGYRFKTIFDYFGCKGGNVKIMVSCLRNHHFHGWRGAPEAEAGTLAGHTKLINTSKMYVNILECI